MDFLKAIGGGFLIATLAFINLVQAIPSDAHNFYVSSKLQHKNIAFKNAYGMELSGTLFLPKKMQEGKKYPAIIVGHPFGAVREQAANLYAQKIAEAGFITLTFDQSFWGESAGEPRGAVLPDVYVENFSAALDYLITLPFIDSNNIGVLGICASGGFALAAAKIDPRIKAVATSSMYDMGAFFRTGLKNNRNKNILKKDLLRAAQTRTQAIKEGKPIYGPGQNDAIFLEAKESNAFYKTKRGQVASNNRRTTPATYAKFLNFYPFNDLDLISPRPILFVVGEIAPSRSFTESAYKLASQPKELVVIKGANRTDLYDRTNMIPWNKFIQFFHKNLK
ncbi:alpha/beta hydrolase [Helicobacter suis]|uniref:alpha/beta hydrolase n=1 Tax=Helicobacter suis TaxID=104628 RepID=UPI0019673833|nr:alpha/beta hydrolase [Helicobacter suis]